MTDDRNANQDPSLVVREPRNWRRAIAPFVLGATALGIGGVVATDNLPWRGERPHLGAATEPRIETSSTSTTVETPPTTTTEPQLLVREMQPGARIGTMTVEISGGDARQALITHELITDARLPEEITAGVPVDVDRSNQVLERGFMVHRDSYIPGWNEAVVSAADRKQKYPTIIAGHRASQIQGSQYGSLVLRDIDKIQAGDKLTMTLDGGTAATYQATDSERISADDISSIQRLFHGLSDKDTLLLYACDTSNPQGIPEQGLYNSDVRMFVKYTRIQ